MRTLFSLFAALALTVGLAVPVLAESEYAWPRANSVYGLDAYRSGPSVKTPTATYDPWNDSFVPFGSSRAATASDAGGQFPTDAKALDAQVAGYREYWYRRNAQIIGEGGYEGPSVPVRLFERDPVARRAFSGDNGPALQGRGSGD